VALVRRATVLLLKSKAEVVEIKHLRQRSLAVRTWPRIEPGPTCAG
jgi:hypothetical protein